MFIHFSQRFMYLFSSRWRWLTLSILSLFIIASVLSYRAHGSLSSAVSQYAAAQKNLSQSTFLPGATNNEKRAAAHRALAEVLTGTLSDVERVKRSQDGLALLKDLQREIDAIGDARNVADRARADLATHQTSIADVRYHHDLVELNELAERQISIAEDIRGLSYSAAYYTTQIFDKLIAAHGVLSGEFATTLNSEIPEVEKQFNKRSNLYVELEGIDSRIAHILAGLPGGQ